MSVVGYRAKNHPQQVALRGPAFEVDDRTLPQESWDLLDARFGFTVDAAASDANARCLRYWTREEDGLAQSWSGESVWCNPPYSDIEPWVRKAWAEADEARLIVMLLPANRTEQGWWQDLIEPFRDAGTALRVEFRRGRERFIAPGRSSVGPNERPPFGLCLCIWRPVSPVRLAPLGTGVLAVRAVRG